MMMIFTVATLCNPCEMRITHSHTPQQSQQQHHPMSSCATLSVCIAREPGVGSGCVLRGQCTSQQSVILPEAGMEGSHNAG